MIKFIMWLGGSGLLQQLASILEKRADAAVAARTSDNVTGAQVAAELLKAQIETNKLKVANNAWWGAQLIILVAALPCAIHIAGIMLDSTFRFGWGIPRVPAPYDTYEWAIVQSFFILQPVNGLIGVINAWVRR